MPTIEKTFLTSPGPQPNGMQATEEGLWILDQQTNEVHLVSYDGDVKKTLAHRFRQRQAVSQTQATHSGWRPRIVVKSLPQIQKAVKTRASYETPGAETDRRARLRMA